MIRVLEIPSVRQIETRVRLNALTGTRQDFELDEWVRCFIQDILGIMGNPAEIQWEADHREGLDLIILDEDSPPTAEEREADNIRCWAEDGWDVRGEDGRELACLSLIEDALLCVDEGLAGRPKVEIEAMIWGKSRTRDHRADPKGKARDAAFLDLADPHSRR